MHFPFVEFFSCKLAKIGVLCLIVKILENGMFRASGSATLWLALVGVVTLLTSHVRSFPDGAPVEVCITHNYPNHAGAKPLPPSKFPYAFTASSNVFHPGSVIKVILSGPPFKGFNVQAREGGPDGKWIGSFLESPHSKLHDECSAVTHNHPGPKEKVVLTWKAPPYGHSGKVVFLATVMPKYDVYWVNVLAKVPVHGGPGPIHGGPGPLGAHSFSHGPPLLPPYKK